MSDSDPLGRFFDEMMPQALKFFDDLASVPQRETVRPDGDPFSLTRDTEPSPLDALLITKRVGYISVPDELLMDAGIIPDTRPPRPPLPWRWRMRNRIAGWCEKLAYRAFKVIAGYEVPDYDG